jgi:hypothetical protein
VCVCVPGNSSEFFSVYANLFGCFFVVEIEIIDIKMLFSEDSQKRRP